MEMIEKRKRGRPRKGEIKLEISETKRKRGRPRKEGVLQEPKDVAERMEPTNPVLRIEGNMTFNDKPESEKSKITRTIQFVNEEGAPEIFGVSVRIEDHLYTFFKNAPATVPEKDALILLRKEKYGAYNFVEV